jgi:hypothetical protein
MLATFTRPGWNGPLYFLLLRGWVALTGTSEYAMRFFSLAFGVLCVPLIHVVGRRLFGRQTGLLASLLAAVSPYMTWYSQEVKMYTLVPALALLAVYSLRRAIEGQGWHWWAVQIVATSLAFYSHILAALLIPVQILVYLAWWPRARRQWAGALISLACLTLPYLPLLAWQAPLAFQTRQTGFHPYSLGEMVEILLNGWSLGISGWGWPWGAILMGALATWGAVRPLRGLDQAALPSIGKSRESREREAGSTVTATSVHPTTCEKLSTIGNRLALVCWIAVPLLAVWIISLRQPLFTDRYLIWTAPAFYLLAALGLTSLGSKNSEGQRSLEAPCSFQHFSNEAASIPFIMEWRHWGTGALAGIVLALNGINLWRQAVIPVKSDFRAAAVYVAGRRAPGELILFQIPYGKHAFDYYFPDDEYSWAEGLYTNHRAPDASYLMNAEEAAHRMQEMTAEYRAVWLVSTEAAMWDDRGLVQAWLEANWGRVDEAHFLQVNVYKYVKQ